VTTHDQGGVSRRARAQQVALWRYQLICPALEAGLSTKARGRIVRAIAAGSHQGPFGDQVCYSRHTLDRWIRRYQRGGFEALTPSIRHPRTRIGPDAPIDVKPLTAAFRVGR
jgi:putative transposase